MKNKDRLHEHMSSLSTKELIKITALRKEDYEPEAVEIARNVLSERPDALQEEVLQTAIKEEEGREKNYWKIARNQRDDTILTGFVVLLIFFGIGVTGIGVAEIIQPEFDDTIRESMITICIGVSALLGAVLLNKYRKRRKRLEAELGDALDGVKLA